MAGGRRTEIPDLTTRLFAGEETKAKEPYNY
jgi:hypothetical protein